MPSPDPSPKETHRRTAAEKVRHDATTISAVTSLPNQNRNTDLANFSEGAGTFTKGLKHDDFGRVERLHLDAFIDFINQGTRTGFAYSDPKGDNVVRALEEANFRRWESPLAGHVYSLIGADADAIGMPPAPEIGSSELAAEMAEIYALALLRDKSFHDIVFEKTDYIRLMNQLVMSMPWFNTVASDKEEERRLARLDDQGVLHSGVLYRGSTVGAKSGPYLSQFLLVGHAVREHEDGVMETCSGHGEFNSYQVGGCGEEFAAKDGYILYGTQLIDQRTHPHKNNLDYMQNWDDWRDIQDGNNSKNNTNQYEKKKRFITTPRDLASYVHFDQLYQAYLNATLILLGYNFPLDAGLPEGGGAAGAKCHPNRDGFATFGGPHILSLVCEVASRALKFARRQKFNIHLRARPESIAALLTLSVNGKNTELGSAANKVGSNAHELANILTEVAKFNGQGANPHWLTTNALLPMAFPEGSPMHPSYAAGHATVAGACVTIIKAFFEMFEVERDSITDCPKPANYDPNTAWNEVHFAHLYGSEERRDQNLGVEYTTGIFEPTSTDPNDPNNTDQSSLRQLSKGELVGHGPITILGELDKLAANISIGRNMAGVHYYTDYYESLRMGERVAVSILLEQMLTYPEPVKMRFKSFDGDQVVLKGDGDGHGASAVIADQDGTTVNYDDWMQRRT